MKVDPVTNITDLLMVAGGGGGMAFDPSTNQNSSAISKQTSHIGPPANGRTSLMPETKYTTDIPSNQFSLHSLEVNFLDKSNTSAFDAILLLITLILVQRIGNFSVDSQFKMFLYIISLHALHYVVHCKNQLNGCLFELCT
jgi:hypothetical protein